jgi:hypothetical protein
MSKWIGRRAQIGIGKETARGTVVAPTYWLPVVEYDFADKPTRAMSEATYGGIWAGSDSPQTLRNAEGSITAELGIKHFGLILLATLGTVTTTGPTDATAYTHTYTLQNDNQHDSLTFVVVDPIGTFKYAMGMINTLEIKAEPNSIITYSADIISKSSMDADTPSVSYVAEDKFVGRHLYFYVAATAAALPGTRIDIKSLTLTFEKNAEVNATLSTIQPEDIVNKRFNIKGEVELTYEDRTWLNYVKDGNYKAVRIKILGDTLITGAATTYPSLTLDLSRVSFEDWKGDFGMDDITKQTLSFTALYDPTNANVINSCVLINGVTSY